MSLIAVIMPVAGSIVGTSFMEALSFLLRMQIFSLVSETVHLE